MILEIALGIILAILLIRFAPMIIGIIIVLFLVAMVFLSFAVAHS